MIINRLMCLAPTLLLLCAGCMTTVKTTKVTNRNDMKVKGVRYSLPQPVIVVKPDVVKGGKPAVSVDYWPDESRTYAIHSTSYFSSNDLQVQVAEGLLTKVVFKPKAGTVPGKAAEVAGKLVEKHLLLEEEERKADATALENSQKNLKTARDSVKKAEKELLLAQLDLESYLGAINPEEMTDQQREKVRTLELAVAKKQVDLDLAKAELDSALTSYRNTYNAISNAPGSPKRFHGPVYYAVKDNYKPDSDTGEVALVPINFGGSIATADDKHQVAFTTTVLKKEKAAPVKPNIRFTGSPYVYVERNPQKTYTFTQTLSEAVDQSGHVKVSGIDEEGRSVDMTEGIEYALQFTVSGGKVYSFTLKNKGFQFDQLIFEVNVSKGTRTANPDFKLKIVEPDVLVPTVLSKGIHSLFFGENSYAKVEAELSTAVSGLGDMRVTSMETGTETTDLKVAPVAEGTNLAVVFWRTSDRAAGTGVYRVELDATYKDSRGDSKDTTLTLNVMVP